MSFYPSSEIKSVSKVYIPNWIVKVIFLLFKGFQKEDFFLLFFVGFDKYKGGLDTVHDLTGLYSVYTHWRGIEIMFHVSSLLPYEKNDPQKV